MKITSEPRWLDATFIHLLHRESIQQHSGSDGVRDHGLLESALARPQHRYAYTPDVTLAASYGFGIVRNLLSMATNARACWQSEPSCI